MMIVPFNHLVFLVSSVSFIGMVSSVVLKPDQNQILDAGKSFVMSCFGSYHDTQLSWKKNGKTIMSTTQDLNRVHTGLVNKDPETKLPFLTLLFPKLQITDSGQYSCNGQSNSLTQSDASFNLTVISALKFRDTSKRQSGKKGSNPFVVRCEAEASGSVKIRWTSPGRNLAHPKYEMGGDGLYIYNLQPEDAGPYSCIAYETDNGRMASFNISVEVEYPPEWSDIPTKIYKQFGNKVSLECGIVGYPPISIRWFVNETLLQEQESVIYAEKSGNYTCEATNKLGSISREMVVMDGIVPERPEKPKAHNTTSSSVFLDFKRPKEGSHRIMGYMVELRDKTGKFSKAVNITNDPPFIITDLKPGTTYVLRMKATNEVGHGEYSLEVEVTTDSGAAAHSSILYFIFICVIMAISL